MTPKTVRKTAFIKSIPIMCSYLFVAMAYGMMMQEAGFAWYDSLLASLTIYTGAFQFVLITFLSSGASVLTIAVTALLMNSRQAFYSLSFVDKFKKMGRKMPYMIHTMTDETYAVNCTLTEQGGERREVERLLGGKSLLLGCVFLADKLGLTQITKSGYRDLFFSVTVSYVIGAIVY